MSSMQIVFLFDLNAYKFVKTIEELQEKLVSLRLTCLRILTHYSTTVSNLKWGFKFFDSRGSPTQTMCNFSFQNVSLENFETLENEICLKFQRHFLYLEALTLSEKRCESSQGDENFNDRTEVQQTPIQLLHLALTQILYEYQWNDSIDMFSPSTRKTIHKNKRNLLFLISKCASNAEEFKKYFGTEYILLNTPKLNKLLLSQSLQQQLLHKEGIQWIWLNSFETGSFIKSFEPDVLRTIADSLRSLQCALVPLSVLSFPNCIVKLSQKLNEDVETPVFSILNGSLVPFPSSMYQSISYPFYKFGKENAKGAELCFSESTLRFIVNVTTVPVQWIKKEKKSLHNGMPNQTNCTESPYGEKDSLNMPSSWTKFTIYFAVAKNAHLKSSHILLCMPDVSTKSSNCLKFQVLLKSLFIRKINLFVICESSCGPLFPGIFTPLSDSSAVISILEPNRGFTNMSSFKTFESLGTFNASYLKEGIRYLEEEIENFELNSTNSNTNYELINERSNHFLRPFTMVCLERWFVPTSSFCSSLSALEDKPTCDTEVAAFHDLLQQSNSLRKKTRKKVIEDQQKPVPKPEKPIEQTNDQEEEDDDMCKDLSYDQLVAVSTETYSKALESSGSVLYYGRKIIKMASSFFLKQSIIKYEENMKNFMTEYFIINCRKLIEKYGANQDEETATKAINECKLQVILALEMEILFPSFGESSSVISVSSFLGIMCFFSGFSGATVLVKYLQNDLLESYGHKLYDLLVDIGEELCIPLKSEDDSPADPFEASSPVSLTEIASSVSSATLSLISSQNASNKSESRKLIRKRSDISITSKRRQILLPGKSPKKKKSKTALASDSVPIRYSPRLASKKRRDRSKTAESDSKSVRRNLFSQDRKIQTPRSNTILTRTPVKKKKVYTPKSHHVLKTDFVPGTPAPKQKFSYFQKRKSQLNFNEDSESTPSKSAKGCSEDDFVPNTPAYKLIAGSPTISKVSETKNYASCSSTQYTPESKRRLSLKLFSKALASPTARMGLKKCSKRLFDQVESLSQPGPSKRFKF